VYYELIGDEALLKLGTSSALEKHVIALGDGKHSETQVSYYFW